MIVNNELQEIKTLLENEITNKLNDIVLGENEEQRTVGDKIEGKCVDIIKNIENENIVDVIERRSKKSIEDVTLISKNHKIYIDPKTIDISPDLSKEDQKKFSMPNLTAILKIKNEIYKYDNVELMYISVKYELQNKNLLIKKVQIFYLWELDLESTRFGNLGSGQLQIKNGRDELIFSSEDKVQWYEKFLIKIKTEFFPMLAKSIVKSLIEWEFDIDYFIEMIKLNYNNSKKVKN